MVKMFCVPKGSFGCEYAFFEVDIRFKCGTIKKIFFSIFFFINCFPTHHKTTDAWFPSRNIWEDANTGRGRLDLTHNWNFFWTFQHLFFFFQLHFAENHITSNWSKWVLTIDNTFASYKGSLFKPVGSLTFSVQHLFRSISLNLNLFGPFW